MTVTPILRLFDEAATRDFSLGFLGAGGADEADHVAHADRYLQHRLSCFLAVPPLRCVHWQDGVEERAGVSAASPACSRSSPQWKRSPPTATGDPPRAPAPFARPAHARRASISGHPTFHSLRQLSLLGARQFTYVTLAGCEKIVGADASDSDPGRA